MTERRTRGLVLSVGDHGESDKIVVFFSPDIGKASGIAKGAKRSKKRFVNKLEPFSLLRIHYRPSRNGGLLFLSEADLENAFLSLRNSYDRYIAAMYAGELTLRFTRELDPDPALFTLLIWAMQALDDGRDPLAVTTLFHLRLLGIAGYEPVFDRCGLCGGRLQAARTYTLHGDSGSVVCDRCRHVLRGAVVGLSIQTMKFLHHAQQTNITNLGRLRLNRTNSMEALGALHRYTRYLLQNDLNSWRQFRQMMEH